MCHEIRIGNIKLQAIESVTVESSIDGLSDTCIITLPGSVFNQRLEFAEKIKRGDKVEVRLGYNEQLHTEFMGYVRTLNLTSPLKIECEDSAFLFRRPVKDKSFKKKTALDVLKYTIEQINLTLKPDEKLKLVSNLKGLQLDSFTIVNANGYEVLQKLKEEFGIGIYCRGKEVHCHLLYTEKRGYAVYDFAKNIEEGHNLEYVSAEERKVEVKVQGKVKRDGKSKKLKSMEVKAGKSGGNVITINRPGISDQKTLAAIARNNLKKYAYAGYEGSVRGWLWPICEIGYSVKLIDKEFPEREGVYFAKGVKTEFSRAGGVRTVGLGIKLSTSNAIDEGAYDLTVTL